MLVLLRFDAPPADGALDAVLAVLADEPGFRWGAVTRSPDDPAQWLVATLWRDAGSMRRGVGSVAAKVALGPLQVFSGAGSGVFEVLSERSGASAGSTQPDTVRSASDRAADAHSAGPLH